MLIFVVCHKVNNFFCQSKKLFFGDGVVEELD